MLHDVQVEILERRHTQLLEEVHLVRTGGLDGDAQLLGNVGHAMVRRATS